MRNRFIETLPSHAQTSLSIILNGLFGLNWTGAASPVVHSRGFSGFLKPLLVKLRWVCELVDRGADDLHREVLHLADMLKCHQRTFRNHCRRPLWSGGS